MRTPADGCTRPFQLPALPPTAIWTSSVFHPGFGLIQNRRFFQNLLTAIVLLISSGRTVSLHTSTYSTSGPSGIRTSLLAFETSCKRPAEHRSPITCIAPSITALYCVCAVEAEDSGDLTDGTCNEEQIEICRESALDGRLASLRSGGLCSPKHYAEFSHLCSVTNYLPSVEYCCCIYETSVLCCRYHQDWNLFRCQLEEDLIDTTTGSQDLLNDEGDDQTSLCCPPLELLLPAILVPLVVVICCLYVCFKYWVGGGQCGSEGLCSTQADDDAANISPRKNHRRTNGVIAGDIALSSSLTNSDAISSLPLTCATTNHMQPSSKSDKPGLYPRSPDRSEEIDQTPFNPIYSGPHRFFSAVEPTAPPLFDELEASSCAFSHCYHEPQESLDEFYTTPARHRDSTGRAHPLYRNGRNFSSGGRCSAPLVHRITPGHYPFRSKYDRSAACRLTSCPIRACSPSPPPPPSYEQSCNQDP